MDCRGYLVLQAYVPLEASLPRAVRILESRYRARIVGVNEELRRIVANVPISRAGGLIGDCGSILIDCTAEVKYSCRAKCLSGLKAVGFLVRGRIAYGIVEGRLIEVEESRAGVRVKIGRRTTQSRPSPPIPPSMFIHDIGEALRVAGDARRILEFLGGACGG